MDELTQRAHREVVTYLLDRAQTNPDLGYLIGRGTEAFRLLCLAEARRLAEDPRTIEQRRGRDLQARHAWRPVELEELRRERDLLREELSEARLAAIGVAMDGWRSDQRERALVARGGAW
jgi:hypothetical protein